MSQYKVDFFDCDRIIIATNGFIKTTNKTPRSEISLAKQRRAIYFSRKEASKNEWPTTVKRWINAESRI